MAIEGSLQTTRLTQLLNLIKLAKKSGMLHIHADENGEAGAHLVEIAFSQGALTAAISKTRGADLVRMLRKCGKLNDKQAESVEKNRLGRTDKALAIMLVNGNYLSQDDIMQCVQRVTLDIVYDVMTWESGLFHFDETDNPLPDRILLEINLDGIIKKGNQLMDEIKELEQAIPDLDVVVQLSQERATTMMLTSQQWQVLGLVTGDATIREIADECHLTDTEIRRVIKPMIDKHVVELLGN